MEERTIRGVLGYNGNEYPFVLEKRLLSIVQAYRQYQKDFIKKDELGNSYIVDKLGNLHGVTDRNEDIFLLNCRIFDPNLVEIGGSIQISLQGYIIQTEPDDGFDRIDFYSPALTAFYPPYKAWKVNHADTGVILAPREEIVFQTPVTIGGEELECFLNFSRYFNYKPEEQHPLSIYPVFSIIFPQRKTSAELGQYYLYVHNFLSLVNFRTNISFDDIILYKLDTANKLYKLGNAVIFEHLNINYTPDPYHCIAFEDLGSSSFAALFEEVAEHTLQQTYNPFFLPRNKNDIATVDPARWLVAAISFEGEFDKAYSDYKAEQYPEFHKVKELLLSTINSEVKKTPYSINNKRNKHYSRFYHLIDNFDTTIKEKFIYTQQKLFKGEFEDVLMKYCKSNAVSPTTDFADVYEKTRNQTAHGAIRKISPEGVVVFQLLRCFIHLLIFERANVPSEQRKLIVNKLFLYGF